MTIEFARLYACRLLAVWTSVLLLVGAGCATIQQPQRDNLASEDAQLVFSVNGLAILGLGLLPGTLMSVCLGAMLSGGM